MIQHHVRIRNSVWAGIVATLSIVRRLAIPCPRDIAPSPGYLWIKGRPGLNRVVFVIRTRTFSKNLASVAAEGQILFKEAEKLEWQTEVG